MQKMVVTYLTSLKFVLHPRQNPFWLQYQEVKHQQLLAVVLVQSEYFHLRLLLHQHHQQQQIIMLNLMGI